MTQAIQPRISVSLVLYQADLEMVMQVVHRLVDAYCYAGFFSGLHIYLIDNGGSSSVLSYFQREYISWKSFMTFDWISGHGNIGYGAAHNLAIRRADSDFHLILNPDVLIDKATFVEACRFFNNHPEAGLIAPYVSDGNGKMQYLCKRYPSLWVLFLRGFTPEWIQRRCKKRLEAYIMKDVINADQIFWDPPIVSGCFMLFRTDVLKSLGGFDPNFFLYFEDFDLSLRASRLTRLAYVPTVRIIHFGGYASEKGLRHILYFFRSALRFFTIHGWKLL